MPPPLEWRGSLLEMYISAVPSRPYREVYPDRRAAFLKDQLIEVHLLLVRDIQ